MLEPQRVFHGQLLEAQAVAALVEQFEKHVPGHARRRAEVLSLEMGPGKAAASSAAQPFRTEAGLFVPRASFEVHPGQPERLVLIVWDPAAPGDPAADVEIRSSLTAADGQPVPAGRLRIERVHRDGGGRRTFVFSYAPEAIAAGDYTLRIGLGEGGRIAEAYARLRFRPRS